MMTVDGGVPLRVLAVSVTFTFTVSVIVGAGVAVIVNVASVTSVTLGGSAVIVMTGVTPGMTHHRCQRAFQFFGIAQIVIEVYPNF